jgi:hypothetical protein
MQRVWKRKRACRFCWGNMNGRKRYFEDLGIGGDDNEVELQEM